MHWNIFMKLREVSLGYEEYQKFYQKNIYNFFLWIFWTFYNHQKVPFSRTRRNWYRQKVFAAKTFEKYSTPIFSIRHTHKITLLVRRHDIQLNGHQHNDTLNDTQHNDTPNDQQHNDTPNDTQHNNTRKDLLSSARWIVTVDFWFLSVHLHLKFRDKWFSIKRHG